MNEVLKPNEIIIPQEKPLWNVVDGVVKFERDMYSIHAVGGRGYVAPGISKNTIEITVHEYETFTFMSLIDQWIKLMDNLEKIKEIQIANVISYGAWIVNYDIERKAIDYDPERYGMNDFDSSLVNIFHVTFNADMVTVHSNGPIKTQQSLDSPQLRIEKK